MRAMVATLFLAACGGATAAPLPDGGACTPAYAACHALSDCCPDAICSHAGTASVGVCSPYCQHNADCETGCCVTVGTAWACVEASACSGSANEQHP